MGITSVQENAHGKDVCLAHLHFPSCYVSRGRGTVIGMIERLFFFLCGGRGGGGGGGGGGLKFLIPEFFG